MWKEKKLGKRAGINPVQLEFKEGIALDNATALSLEALLEISDAYDERIQS